MHVRRAPAALAALALAACAQAPAEVVPSAPVGWTPAAVSSDQYESSPTFSPDGREMYLLRADPQFRSYRLVQSSCIDGAWSAPVPVPFAMPLPVIEADPFVTRDGRRLYYVSSRAAPEREDFDIWFVDRAADGGWGTPQRLPAPVNSAHVELLPRIGEDGALYFGSDRPGGHGQSDIYRATQDAGGRWTVANVGPPVSTAANDFEADISAAGDTLVLVSDRGTRSHLYHYVKRDGRWVETGRLPGTEDVFQVGPTLSPSGDRLLFAQRDGARSGEIFLVDLKPNPDRSWPPCSRP